jgi:hypothetical protein
MNAIARLEPQDQSPAISQESAIDRIIAAALNQDIDIDRIKELYALKLQHEANEARKQFNIAFAHFKAEAVRVYKGTTITDGPLKGKRHANLFDVVVASAAPLAKFGLSTSWNLTKDEPTLMEVTCVLKHSAGHSESVSMAAAPDTGPGRNAIQARGSAKSYLERYTLMAILGLAATDQEDDDGRGGGESAGDQSPEQIEAERAAAAKRQEWLDVINACTDATELAARKKELVDSCGGGDMVPADLRKACVDKAAALKGAKK